MENFLKHLQDGYSNRKYDLDKKKIETLSMIFSDLYFFQNFKDVLQKMKSPSVYSNLKQILSRFCILFLMTKKKPQHVESIFLPNSQKSIKLQKKTLLLPQKMTLLQPLQKQSLFLISVFMQLRFTDWLTNCNWKKFR